MHIQIKTIRLLKVKFLNFGTLEFFPNLHLLDASIFRRDSQKIVSEILAGVSTIRYKCYCETLFFRRYRF